MVGRDEIGQLADEVDAAFVPEAALLTVLDGRVDGLRDTVEPRGIRYHDLLTLQRRQGRGDDDVRHRCSGAGIDDRAGERRSGDLRERCGRGQERAEAQQAVSCSQGDPLLNVVTVSRIERNASRNQDCA